MADRSKIQVELSAIDRNMSSTLRQVSVQMQSFSGIASKVSSGVKMLAVSVAGATAAMSFDKIVELADTYTLLTGRLKLVTSSQQELNATQDSLYQMAQRTRASYESTVEVFTRFARATKEVDISQSDLLKVVESINKAVIVSGATQTEAHAALIQLSQGMASGTLRGEELNSVMEQTPKIAQMIADGLGLSTGQLREFGKEGKLTADMVLKAIASQGDRVNQEFEKMPTTVGQATTKISNALGNIISGINEATGFTAGLAARMNDVAEGAERAAKSWRKMFDETATGDIMRLLGGSDAWNDFAPDDAQLNRVEVLKGQIQSIEKLIANRNPETMPLGVVDERIKTLETLKVELVKLTEETVKDLTPGGKKTKPIAMLPSAEEVAKAYKEAYGVIGATVQPVYDALKKQYEADREAFIKSTGDKATADNIFKEQMRKLDESASNKKGRDKAAREAAKAEREYNQEVAAGLKFREALGALEDEYGSKQLEHLEREKQQFVITWAQKAATAAEYQNRILAIEQWHAEASARIDAEAARKRTTSLLGASESAVALKEAQVSEQLTKGSITANEALRKQVQLLQERKQAIEDYLESAPVKTLEDIASWNAQAAALSRVNSELYTMNRTLAASDWSEAAKQGLEDVARKSESTGETIKSAIAGAFRSADDAIAEFVTTGKLKVTDLVNSIIADFARMASQKYITGPLAGALAGLFGGGSSGGTVSENFSLDAIFNAKGGAYRSAGLSAYANSIVSTPTVFPFARGIGLMGEAGPEAIMPLTRSASGRLGVEASGGWVVVNVIEAPGQGGQQQRRQENGVNMIDIFVERIKGAMATDIAQGAGALPMALQSTYGLNRVR